MKTNSQEKICSKCQAKIECFAENISKCECSKVSLTHDTLAFLKLSNYYCLCNKCLIEVNDLVEKSKLYRFPEHRDEMIEGIHYYIENDYFVFTSLYHILRGKCCQSGCRHCAYGFKK